MAGIFGLQRARPRVTLPSSISKQNDGKCRPTRTDAAAVRLELRDLDCRRQTLIVDARAGVLASKLASVIRRRSREAVPGRALVLIYQGGRELPPHCIVQDEPVFYRIETFTGDSGLSLAFEVGGRSDFNLARDIELADLTVGETRSRVAHALGVDDTRRIRIVLDKGMRVGPLEGDGWSMARAVRAWLCSAARVEVYPRSHYLVLRGLSCDYVYHPKAQGDRMACARRVKSWIRQRLVHGVHQNAASSLSLRTRDISLALDGEVLAGFADIAWGSVIDFTLPDNMAEAFADDETWLLSATETCDVCCDVKAPSEFVLRITSACQHRPTICKLCLRQWLESNLDEAAVGGRLPRCPECPALLEHADVRRLAAARVFARFDNLLTRNAVGAMPGFRFCTRPSCESGQVHAARCPKFTCHACGAKHCVNHGIPWHKGETCDEYDVRNRRRRKEEQKSAQAARGMSKPCPACKRDVHKSSGCNHITCVCGHEWCYLCFAPYQQTPAGFLRCQHINCSERDIFADLGFP
jgi:hypothetical protein